MSPFETFLLTCTFLSLLLAVFFAIWAHLNAIELSESWERLREALQKSRLRSYYFQQVARGNFLHVERTDTGKEVPRKEEQRAPMNPTD